VDIFVYSRMQGIEKNPPMEEYIPQNNFYRILRKNLNLHFIYKETEEYYSHTGRPGFLKKSNQEMPHGGEPVLSAGVPEADGGGVFTAGAGRR
jgi:hypothetical protein